MVTIKDFKNNIKLVESIVNRKYKYMSNFTYLEKDDLFQEGLIGLYKAIKNYDVSKNTELSIYAKKVIENSVKAYISKVSGYKSSVIIKPDAYKLYSGIIKYLEKNENITVEELCKVFKKSIKQINESLEAIKYLKKDPVDVQDYEDCIKLNKNIDILDRVGAKLDVENLLNCLSQKEKEIVELYFGLDNNYQMIGSKYDLSKQRVEQIINRALKKLRRAVAKELKDYITVNS